MSSSNTTTARETCQFSVAPMMDWTDRHCRFFHRLLSRRALLYTEMVTTGALLHGDVPRHLDFDAREAPVVLQLGGSEPEDLARCAQLGEQWGYNQINLNCGCPSERVQRGAFGACLMREPELVRDGVRAMCEAVAVPVTVKHRIGVDRELEYGFVRDFIGTVAEGGARSFIVHARAAWLSGLSPKQNREVPPLRYDFAYRLKTDFPALQIVINGGITNLAAAAAHLQHVDGVMLGREAYQNPWLLASVDSELYGDVAPALSRMQVIESLVEYADELRGQGRSIRLLTRHVLGLFNGLPGARAWRRLLSDPAELACEDPLLLRRAAQCVDLDAHVSSRWSMTELQSGGTSASSIIAP